MIANGSPSPKFETDENQNYFLVTLPIHPETSRKTSSKEKSTLNEEKDRESELKTHQLEPETHQLEPKTRQLEEFLEAENLPDVLKSKIEKLNKRSKNEEVRSVIYALCSWKPLTAQEIAKFLNRKDKKHLVTQYLTPLVKDGKLKYIYPERGTSPNQAYTV